MRFYYILTFLWTRRLKQLFDEVDTPEHKTLIKEIQLLLLMSDDEFIGNNDQPSIETSPNIINILPNDTIDDELIETKYINLAVDGKLFFSSPFPSME